MTFFLPFQFNWRFGAGFCFTVVYAALLTKTNRIARIFKASEQSAKRPSFISPQSQLIICSALISIQVRDSSTFLIKSYRCIETRNQTVISTRIYLLDRLSSAWCGWSSHHRMPNTTTRQEKTIYSFVTPTLMLHTWLHSSFPSFLLLCARSTRYSHGRFPRHSMSRSILASQCIQRASFGWRLFHCILRRQIMCR